MRTLKRVSLAVVLALMLGTSAMAGIIECPPAPEPPPPSDQTTGITDTPPSATQEPTDPVVMGALEVLQSLLTVF
jgi:hypothetical protein